MDERAGDAAILRTLARALTPAMKLVDQKVRSSRTEDAEGKVVRQEILGNGLVVVDRFREDPDGDPDVAQSGTYGGSRLLVMRGGRFVEQARSGSWGPGGGEWRSTSTEVSPEEAARRWPLDPADVVQVVGATVARALARHREQTKSLEDVISVLRGFLASARGADQARLERAARALDEHGGRKDGGRDDDDDER